MKGKLERKKRKIILLGSSHGRGMGQMLQENLGSRFEVCIFLNQMLLLQTLLRMLESLVKTLPSKIILSL
jgi:hypothetical protein